MHAAGYPYYTIAGTSLNLTGGNVSALAGVDDDRRFFSFSAPVQPGNSGGPLIDAHGGVLGLVVARLSEDFIVEATGTLPQNVNYALREDELADFLRQNGVPAAGDGLGELRHRRRRAAGLRRRRRADHLRGRSHHRGGHGAALTAEIRGIIHMRFICVSYGFHMRFFAAFQRLEPGFQPDAPNGPEAPGERVPRETPQHPSPVMRRSHLPQGNPTSLKICCASG